MEEQKRPSENDSILPVFFWIFFVATVAVFLILTATLLSRNGTFDRWKTQYVQWKEEREAIKRAETAGEKTVNYFGPSGVADYAAWVAGEWKTAVAQGLVDVAGTGTGETEKDPLREALTASPIKGDESWWSKAKKLTGTVTLYARAETPLYGAPEKNGTVYGYGKAGEVFSLLAVFEDGWYVVSDGRFYYCSKGESYTMIPLEATDFEGLLASMEKQKVYHEVETVLQNPELPHGCEVTALAMLFSHYDISADKCELADRWLHKGAWGQTDFREAFVGDPRKRVASAGCFASVIADAANRYLAVGIRGTDEQNAAAKLAAVAKEDVSFQELLAMVAEAPVVAWTTMDLQAPYIAQVWEVDGEELYWQNYEHCVVLTGYDAEKGVLYGTDPLYGPCEYDMKLFSVRFRTMYSQVVQITEDTP